VLMIQMGVTARSIGGEQCSRCGVDVQGRRRQSMTQFNGVPGQSRWHRVTVARDGDRGVVVHRTVDVHLSRGRQCRQI